MSFLFDFDSNYSRERNDSTRESRGDSRDRRRSRTPAKESRRRSRSREERKRSRSPKESRRSRSPVKVKIKIMVLY